MQDSSRKIGKGMLFISWILALALITYWFGNWEKNQNNPNQQPTGYYDGNNEYTLEIEQNRYGHYVASGEINNYPVTFMFDTGATDVVIPEKTANKIGLEKGAAHYAQTANGTITVYHTILDRLSIGKIHLSQIRASINPNMGDDEVLLGMSALKQLTLTQKNNILTLQHTP